MLRFAEEILLLLRDEDSGDIAPNYPPHLLDIVLAGAVLMDLALEDRIDTDILQLILVDSTPVGDDLLDPTLADIAEGPLNRDAGFWLTHTARRGNEIREKALARLVERGILEIEADGLFFFSRNVSRSRRYPTGDGTTVEEVRLRIMRVLFSDDIPDPHDIVIICLADACGIWERILSIDEQAEVAERIELVQKMDLIGQSLTRAIRELEQPDAPTPDEKKQIPRVSGLAFIANAMGIKGNLNTFLLKQYRALGPVFRVQALNRRFIVLAGTEANQFVARNNALFRTRENWLSFHADVGATRTVNSMDGPEHIRMRREQAKAYSRKLIENRLAEALYIVQQDISSWPQNKPMPVQHTFQRIVTRQLAMMATSTDVKDYVDDIIAFFPAMLDRHLVSRLPKAMMYMPNFRRARRRVEELGQKIIEDHQPERRLGQPTDYIDELLALHRADPYFMPETDLWISVLGPFLAGLDTVTNITAFMLYELLKHPDLLERVTAEADALFAGGIPTVKDLRELDVLHRAAMETMRRHSLTPMIQRTVSNSFEFEGYTIPSGARIFLALSLPHNMSEYFPDPQRFDIDRYTRERAEHRQRGAYVPFGLGAHICLGSSLAEVLIALNIATILRETNPILHPPDYKLKIKWLPVAQPKKSLKFKMVRR